MSGTRMTERHSHSTIVFDAALRVVAMDPELAARRGARIEQLLGRDVEMVVGAAVDPRPPLRIPLEREVLFVLRQLDWEARLVEASSAWPRDALRAANACIECLAPAAKGNSAVSTVLRRLLHVFPEMRRFAMEAATRELAERSCSIDVRAVASSALRATARRRPTTTRVAVCGDGALISREDAEVLESAVVELLDNAGDAMNERARRDPAYVAALTIEIRVQALRIRMMLVDDGIGIPPNLLPQVFEPWVTSKGASGHLGMGLQNARRLIAKLDGTLDLEPVESGGARAVLDWRASTPPILTP